MGDETGLSINAQKKPITDNGNLTQVMGKLHIKGVNLRSNMNGSFESNFLTIL